jgi:hypothetical protein
LNQENEIRGLYPKDSEYFSFTIKHKPQISTIDLIVLDSKHEKTMHIINGFDNLLFITKFWWQKTKTFYLVAENKNDLYNGFIYRLDPKNGEIISTVSRDRFFK